MKKSNVTILLNRLSRLYPVVNTQLEHQNPFQLLIATILSAQCTDRQVNQVTPKLFSRFSGPEDLANAPLEDIKKIIFPTGFYNNKAKNIKACASALMDSHGGVVPGDIESLTRLPGVGRKTANVVRSVCFGIQTIVVDTHVHRTSRRLGLADHKDPVKVEFQLMKVIPEASWNDLSLQLIYFGRETCSARNPKCGDCPMFDICPAGKKLLKR